MAEDEKKVEDIGRDVDSYRSIFKQKLLFAYKKKSLESDIRTIKAALFFVFLFLLQVYPVQVLSVLRVIFL